MVLEDDRLVELDGREAPREIASVADVPAAIMGLARHNVANALAAAGAARALGASIEQVSAGLRSFEPSAEQTPGRLNFYRVGSRVVIVDFAHNEAGVEALMDVAEGLTGPRDARAGSAFISLIVGAAGDRPDDSLREIGRIAADRADEVAIKESIRYLRGRSRGSLIGELREGMRAAGANPGGVPVYADEVSAIRAELSDPGRRAGHDRPGVLIIMCHEDRAGVVAAIREFGGSAVSPVHAIEQFRGLPGDAER